MKIYIRSNITEEDFRKVLDDPEAFDVKDRARIAYFTTDPVILAKLANDKSSEVRHYVVRNPSTDPKIRMQLLNDENFAVRSGAIYNIDDTSVTDRLVNDPDYQVRDAVAYRTQNPQVLANLADDKVWMVRQTVAYHTRDPQLLAKLADDSDSDVRAAAKYRLRELGYKTKSASKNASLQINVGMNFDSTPVVQITSVSEADEFASEFEYVDSVSAANGLYVVTFNNENIQIFRIANSLSNYKSLLKKDYQDYAKQALEEDGEATLYLFLDSYELTVDEAECRNATAYVNYALNYIQDTYVDGDSFSCINLLQVSNNNIKVVLAGEDEVMVR